MRFKSHQSTHGIELRMGCGERLSLWQTRFLDAMAVRKPSVVPSRQTKFTGNRQ